MGLLIFVIKGGGLQKLAQSKINEVVKPETMEDNIDLMILFDNAIIVYERLQNLQKQ